MESEASGSARTLLIVDDDEALVKLMRRMVERAGYRTLTALTASEALQTYAENRGEIDLVITDLVMSGTDGRSFARDLLALNPGVRILVSTGLRNEEDMDSLREIGVRSFLFKPYNSQELIESIQQALKD